MFKWTRVDLNAPSDKSDFIRVWTTELFNPTRKQATGALKRVKTGGNCCLGVGCEVAKLSMVQEDNTFFFGDDKEDQYLPDALVDFLDISYTGELMSEKHFVEGKGYVYPDSYSAVVKLLNGTEALTDANDKKVSFYKIAKAIILYPREFIPSLTDEETKYINETPIPTWQDYAAARKAHNDSLKNKGDNHGSV